jgi:DNA polymerase/3'-5' exonuclease PolX
MNAITEIQNLFNEHAYLKDLCKEQAGKIKELERMQKESEDLLWRRRLFEESIQKVGAVLNEVEKPSLFETTARTKTFALNKEIAEHLKELGEMTSDFYKTGAYRTAADTIATLDFEVHNGDSLLKIHGIGKGIASKVDQFLDEYLDDAESVASNEGQIIEESDDSEESEESEESESESEFFVSYNPKLTDVFDKLASYEQDSHKRDAYRTAADAINYLSFEVKSGEELSKGPKKVKGIGKGIARIIDEFVETGKVMKLEKFEKAGSTNEEIACILEALASLEGEEHGSKDPFRIRAYRKAAEIIRELDYEVLSGEDAMKLPGIGKGIAKKIDEFLQTGEIARLEKLR